jgi:hypothetical protein
MNERIKELANKARYDSRNEKHYLERVHNREITLDEYQEIYDKKFALLIVEDAVDLMKQEWYDWNNYPKVEGETPRDVGLRVGAKSQTIRLMHMVKKHFGVEE